MDPRKDLAAVEPADRDEVREQERGVDREAELEQERVGFGQDGACEKGERQKRGRCETAERNLPQLLGLAARIGDEGNPVPAPAQADHLPAHRSSSPGVAELVQERGASHDADSPDHDKAVTPRQLAPSLSQWCPL